MNERISKQLVDYLIELEFDDIPSDVIGKAKLCVLDTLGVALAGSITPIGRLVREFALSVGGKDESIIYKYGDRISCVPAAFANSTMACCHNFSDSTLSCVVHCGQVTVPTALALAEREGNTGKEFLVGVITGYEMMTRVGNVVSGGTARMNHHKRGFHTTATVGVFGASMTASKLLNLNADQALNALGHAGSYASGITESHAQADAETQRIHPGIAAQNGISAAMLGKLGLKGPSTVLEGKHGFFAVFGGDQIDIGKIDEDLGNRFLIMDSAFKLHNTSHVWANPLDCLSRMIESYGFQPEDVAEIKVIIPTMYTYIMDSSGCSTYPKNFAEAQNNLPYVLAAMMIFGAVHVTQFSDHALRDPRMKEMAGRVTIEIDPSFDKIFKETDKSPARLRIVLKNGKELSETLDYPRGSPKDPITQEELEEKFVSLTEGILEKEKASELCKLVGKIEDLNNMHNLISHLVSKD